MKRDLSESDNCDSTLDLKLQFVELKPERAVERYTKQINEYSSTIEEYSNVLSYSYYYRSKAYINKKKYDLALEDINKAINLQGNKSFFYANRGLIYKFKGEYDLALKDINKALDLDNGDDSIIIYYYIMRVYALKNDYEKVLYYLEKFVNLDLNFNSNFKDIIMKEPDFESIRNKEKFKNLIKKLDDQ